MLFGGTVRGTVAKDSIYLIYFQCQRIPGGQPRQISRAESIRYIGLIGIRIKLALRKRGWAIVRDGRGSVAGKQDVIWLCGSTAQSGSQRRLRSGIPGFMGISGFQNTSRLFGTNSFIDECNGDLSSIERLDESRPPIARSKRRPTFRGTADSQFPLSYPVAPWSKGFAGRISPAQIWSLP